MCASAASTAKKLSHRSFLQVEVATPAKTHGINVFATYQLGLAEFWGKSHPTLGVERKFTSSEHEDINISPEERHPIAQPGPTLLRASGKVYVSSRHQTNR